MKPLVVAVTGISLSFVAGCEPGGVGDPCVPEEEYSATFSGFALTEVNVESRSFSCETRLCLVNHFQGRVSCPSGQPDPASASPAENVCRIPGSDDAVETAVEPWDLDRTPERAVYCSCRCDGPDPNANYCECPSGYVCRELVPAFRRGKQRQLEGSYCVKSGTEFDLRQVGGPTCATDPDAEACRAGSSG